MTSARLLGPALAALLVITLALPPTAALGQSASSSTLQPPPATTTPADPPAGWPTAPAATASAYLLVDAVTGQVLASRAADDLLPVASTVKILTALTVLQRSDPDDVVVVAEEAGRVGGATVGLRGGDRWTVAQLLDALVARSGNDAATALAIHVGGSVAGFVELMRADARAMGLDDLVLSTPSGLDDDNRLSARHLATIARVAMSDPRFRAIAGRRNVELPGLGTVASRNDLLSVYPDATGIKTGFTDEARYALVGSARRAGRELIAVVLGSATPDARFVEAAALLDHGFEGFAPATVAHRTRLHRAGDTVELSASPLELFVPAAEPVLTVVIELATEAPDEPGERAIPVLWQGGQLAELSLTTSVATRATVTGGAALGRALVDRAYAAMRASTAAGAWPA